MIEAEYKKWMESNLVLGASWDRRPDRDDLGRGASFAEIAQNLETARRMLIARNVPVHYLYDILQTPIDRFDLPFHEFLRYELSQQYLEAAIDEIMEKNDFVLAVEGRRQAGQAS